MDKSIGQQNMERYRQYEQELRDAGDNKKADFIRQAAKTYMNSCIGDFAVANLSIIPSMDPLTGEKITEEGRAALMQELLKMSKRNKKK